MGRGNAHRSVRKCCATPIREMSFAGPINDCDCMKAPSAFDPLDLSLAIKNRGRTPSPWRWEIYEAGKSKPLQQSDFFATMSQATRAGKAALAVLPGKPTAR